MKQLLISLILIAPILLFAQEKGADNQYDIRKQPVLSVFSDMFKVQNVTFTREQKDYYGEYLGTEFQIENLTNVPMDLYIFVVATYEHEYISKSSFEKPDLEDRNLIKLIQTYPDEVSNYEYTQKDSTGAEKKVYQKYPKNIKAGIDKKTGKPYRLEDTITFRSMHFSKYMKNYYFFNEITILIFDSDEKLIFRRNYSVKPIKR